MKKLFYFFVAIALVGAIGCSKDNTDPDPDPEPTTCNYTVKYTVNTSGANLSIDTIIYINKTGDEITLLNTNNFDLSFDVKDKVHAKLYVRGNIAPGENTATYKFNMSVLSNNDCGAVDSNVENSATGVIQTIPIKCSFDHSF